MTNSITDAVKRLLDIRSILLSLVVFLILPNVVFATNLGPGSSQQIFKALRISVAKSIAGQNLTILSQLRTYKNENGQTDVNLEFCWGGSLGITTENDPLHWAVWDVILINMLRNSLSKYGLLDVAQPYLRNVESLAVNRIDALRKYDIPYPSFSMDKTQQWLIPLARDLNLALSQRYKRPPVKFVAVHWDCGGGEIDAKLVTEPKSAKVAIINAFNFFLCEARQLDPWDQNSCYGWNEAVTSSLTLAGDYRYLARWPDGAVTRGQFSVTEERISAKNVFQLTIRR